MSLNQSLSSSNLQTTDVDSTAVAKSGALWSSLACLALGAVILFAVGFAPMEVAHNAAHDTRHSAAFPCH